MSSPIPDQLRVLLVDDDEADRVKFRETLMATRIAADVVEKTTLVDGIAAIVAETVDLVVVELVLPGGGAKDVLAAATAAKLSAPIIVLTGHGDEELAAEMMRLGAVDYISKSSLTTERLSQCVRHAIRVTRAERGEQAAREAVAHQAEQLQQLADASTRIHATLALGETLLVAAISARDLLDVHVVVARIEQPSGPVSQISLSEKYASIDDVHSDGLLWIEAALVDRDGTPVGSMWVADPVAGVFAASDDTILTHLARTASIALENARLYKQARDAWRTRDDVLAIVSHDLRNPLNTVAMAASLMNADADQRARALLQRIERGVVRMNRLIDDLLDASSIEAGTLSVLPTRTPLAMLVRDAMDGAEANAKLRGSRIEVAEVDASVHVLADPHRFQQVLVNLIGNALKFSPKGSVIRVRPTREGDVAEVAVIDEGPGIPAARVGRLFDRYWKANARAWGQGWASSSRAVSSSRMVDRSARKARSGAARRFDSRSRSPERRQRSPKRRDGASPSGGARARTKLAHDRQKPIELHRLPQDARHALRGSARRGRMHDDRHVHEVRSRSEPREKVPAVHAGHQEVE